MLKITGRRVELIFNLSNGIYLFDDQSAIGKTRLAKVMSKYAAYGESVASFTYNDKLRGISLESFLSSTNAKVILIDRYDMYNEDAYEEMINKSTESVILIDCKGNFSVTDKYEMCLLKMTPNEIEVTT